MHRKLPLTKVEPPTVNMVDRMTQLGPWTTGDIISDANNKRIVNVSSELDGNWVIKIKSNKDIAEARGLDELTEVLRLRQSEVRHMIEMPKDSYHMFGQTATEIWFAMKRYDGHLMPAHRGSWKRLAVYGLEFLQDMHRIHRRVYMDMRPENVLVSYSDGLPYFCFADYELVDEMCDTSTRDFDLGCRWYFMARGAEIDEPMYSWRQDLVGLGYLLVQLTSDAERPFIAECFNRRDGGRRKHMTIKELLASRDAEVYRAANPILQSYLNKIAEVSWKAVEPPSVEFYESLEALFRGCVV